MSDDKLSTEARMEDAIILRLKEFNAQWPEAYHGPAHVVVGDENLDDHFIDATLVDVYRELWLRAEGRADDEYNDHSSDELKATAQLLEDLRRFPAYVRERWHDPDRD